MRESALLRGTPLLVAIALLAGCACGPGASSSRGAPARSCDPQAQHLAFAGAFTGTLKCTGGPVQCRPTAAGRGYDVHIEGDVGRAGIVLDITIGGTPGHDYHGPGGYATGAGQDQPAAGLRLTGGGVGPGDWRSEGGGAVQVTSDHDGALTGSVDQVLSGYGGSDEHVSGTWSCVTA